MNERIIELAEQATKYAFEWAEGDSKINPKITPDQWLKAYQEKFAELLIRECARVARATPSPNFHEHLKQQLGHTWDMASVEAGKQIVKHFGVEE